MLLEYDRVFLCCQLSPATLTWDLNFLKHSQCFGQHFPNTLIMSFDDDDDVYDVACDGLYVFATIVY